jgi:hypothetical protein
MAGHITCIRTHRSRTEKKAESNSDVDGEYNAAKMPEESKKKKERNLENVECFNSGNKSYFARDCSKQQK